MQNEKKKEKEGKEKEKVTTTTLDFVSHDLEMMMPGSQLMLTGGQPQYQSMGGGMMPPQQGNMMGGGFGAPTSPYGQPGQPPRRY